ncbi:MAG TPA: DUF4388 domain-containing protein [Ktedonobacterales bacterium]|nr:DUF4388 domain-containing protein [Ktedonobacterales bacterium]
MEQTVQGRILDGDLETLGLQATLKMLALGGKTGILNVVSGQDRLRVTLENGHIVALEELHLPIPDLLEIFRLLGRLPGTPPAALRQAIAQNPFFQLAILQQWRVISAEEAQRYYEFGVTLAISRAVRWERGRFDFNRDVAAIQARAGGARPLNVDHILLDALRIADERDYSGAPSFSRLTVARWSPQFRGDARQLSLTPDEVNVLCLSNGQLPLYAVSYGLLLPEARVALALQRLLEMGLVELVDAKMEAELEHSLVNLITKSQSQLAQSGRASPEQRMLTLALTMGECINDLLRHHRLYARTLRGRNDITPAEANRFIETRFRPLLDRVLREYPRMDEIVRFNAGLLDLSDVRQLDRVVRGRELVECYWDATQLFDNLMRLVFDQALTDEIGQAHAGRQYEDLWAVFLREIDEEMERLASRYATPYAWQS